MHLNRFAGFFIVFCTLLTFVNSASLAMPEIAFEEVLAGLNDKSLTYLDVRNKTELLTDGQVVGSVNIPLPEINEAFATEDKEFEEKYGFPKPDKTASNIVLACRSGVRVLKALESLQSIGYNSFRIYRGSFNDWQAKGGPIIKN